MSVPIYTLSALKLLIKKTKKRKARLLRELKELRSTLASYSAELKTLRTSEKETRASKWSPALQIAAVQRFYALHRRIPLRNDFKHVDWLPDDSTVYRHFGSLATLRKMSGLEEGLRGKMKKGGRGRGGGPGWTDARRIKPRKRNLS